MFNVVLFEPEIPPNTGNIIRLCANTGCRLHLIEPLGFDLDDRNLRRAGLDYREWMDLERHASFDDYRRANPDGVLYSYSTHHTRSYTEVRYRRGDHLLFGPESRGLPVAVRNSASPEARLTLPMMPDSRSLNLSNAVAVVVFEAWRQADFTGSG